MNYLKKIIKYILPFGISSIWSDIKNKELQNNRAARLEEYSRLYAKELNKHKLYNYEESIRILVSKDLNENEIRSGSIPEKDLIFLTSGLIKYFNDHEKLSLLHIGNFVGVSLCYMTNFVRHVHEESLVVAIDPNMEHRGIINPEVYVKTLISNFQLDKNILLVDAFSLEKNLKNDGGVLYISDTGIQIENGCSHALNNFAKIATNKFDICMIDGNHESGYLFNEINSALPLMKLGGFIVLDDILYWEDVKIVFNKLQTEKNFRLITSNERIGIIRVL